jgi:hypothetical protein
MAKVVEKFVFLAVFFWDCTGQQQNSKVAGYFSVPPQLACGLIKSNSTRKVLLL